MREVIKETVLWRKSSYRCTYFPLNPHKLFCKQDRSDSLTEKVCGIFSFPSFHINNGVVNIFERDPTGLTLSLKHQWAFITF